MDFKKYGIRYTYKTDKNLVKKIIKTYFDNFITISKNNRFHNEISKGKHNHFVSDLQKENLSYIFKEFNYNDEWISQNIISANIFQCGLSGNKPRLFFSVINDNNLGIFIITPLFLDLNHAIYNSKNKNYDNKYDICLICNEKRCK